MSIVKNKNDPFVRRSIWEGYNTQCYLCKRPLTYKETEIDHILPKDLESNTQEFEEVKSTFSLPSHFELNSYENFALICGQCNKRKQDKIHNILTQEYLDNAIKIAPKLEKLEQELRTNIQKTKDIALLESSSVLIEQETPVIKIGIFSKTPSPSNPVFDKMLNFLEKFNQDLQNVNWQNIYQEIEKLKEDLDKTSPQSTLIIDAKAHLTIGYMFGYIFRRTSGYSLQIIQNGEIWEYTNSGKLPNNFEIKITKDETSSTKILCLLLNISRNVKEKSIVFIKKEVLTPQFIINVQFKTFPPKLNREEISPVIDTFLKEVKKIIDYGECTQTHIFSAVPFALAVLIGASLNAMGPIQLYEYDDSNNIYTPSYMLKRRRKNDGEYC